MKFALIIALFLIAKKITKESIIKIKSKKLKKFRNLMINSPIYGNSNILHYYYTNLYIGENRTNQTYILDTGSSITTSPCSLCENCSKHLNNPFPIKEKNIIDCNNSKCNMVNNICNDTNYNNSQCYFQIYYSEGSTLEGFFIDEIVNFEFINVKNNDTNKIPIGCTIKESTLFENQLIDGIIGLSNNNKSFTSILKNNLIIKNNIFSLCFADEGGYFTIDEINTLFHTSKNILYTKFKEDNEHYTININNIIINNENFIIKKGAFIDSGSTYTYIPKKFSDKIIKQFFDICDKDENKLNERCGVYNKLDEYGHCFTFKNNTEIIYALKNIFPNIIFNINNELNYTWFPKNYYFNISSEEYNNTICLGFNNKGSKFILGTTWMKGYDIIFNKENYTLGFVPSNCEGLIILQNNLKKIIIISFVIFLLIFIIICMIKIKSENKTTVDKQVFDTKTPIINNYNDKTVTNNNESNEEDNFEENYNIEGNNAENYDNDDSSNSSDFDIK